MAEFTGDRKIVDRRGFLKGSALFAAAAVGVAACGARPSRRIRLRRPSPTEEPKKPAERRSQEGTAEEKARPQQKQDPNKLYDKSGREYRVCERCGGNMYREEQDLDLRAVRSELYRVAGRRSEAAAYESAVISS